MSKSAFIKILLGASPFFFVGAIWLLLTRNAFVKEIFLPSIPRVLQSLTYLFTQDNYLLDVWVSTYRVMTAFIISAILAIPLGLFTGRFPRVAQLVEPFVGFVRYLPIPAFVPLCILWFGLGHEAKIAVIFLGTYFQLIIMIADISRGVQQEYFEAAITLGASQGQLFRQVLWPAALPGIVNACRTAVGWAWTYLVVAEIAGATSGIGFRIIEAQRFIQTPKVFAGIVVIGLL
jgi:NitT/TauT family transport system permease protein